MSSDESTATTLSTFSNRADNKPKLKEHKSEVWEINLIGNLVLNLYHKSDITARNEWCIKKSEMRAKFSEYVTAELKKKLKVLNGTDNIGTLLHRCGFLFNTERGSSMYKIKSKALFEFRNKKLKELDNLKVNNDSLLQFTATDNKDNSKLQTNSNAVLLEDDIEIDESSPKMPLEYQGSTIQRREENFCPTNMSCFICQKNFSTMESFEEHVQIHGDDTDFEFLSQLDNFNSPIFTLSYRLCKNSHNFCFEVETCLEDLVIEKIIVVQSRSFFYVHNMRLPYKYPANGVDRFFVDSHLFTIHVEQPIVLICHLGDSKESRLIEQHHFMRSEEFPKVKFAINPNRLPNKILFEPSFQLADYFPPKEIQDALKDDFYQEKLMSTSNEFRDYLRNEMKLQPQTIGASLNIMLQIEDIDTIQEYLSLKQKNIKLRSYGDEYSFQLKPNQRIFLENILSAYDELILTTRTDIYTNSAEILQLTLQNKSDIKRMKNTFVGMIEAVNTGRISFKCDQKINIHDSYTVIFRPSRLTLRYQYRSLQLLAINMEFLRKFLFPTKIVQMPLSIKSINLYNQNMNAEQLQAIRNIAEGPRNDATYIIFGPPGTGKTTTVVESILQVLKKPDAKILVTASSNSACDEVATRLCKYLSELDIKRGMVRIYSRSCEIRTDTIDDELLENSNMYNGQFYPNVEILHEYRIVVCTLSVVAKLATGKFGRNVNGGVMYTHLFIDEVAASTEIESLMAITTILTPQSCLIISGDHKQLGPILQSKRAKDLGMGVSLMDRLLARDCYRVDIDTGDYDRTIQTRLVRNYRSHAAIVNLYSGLYYNHSLEAMANQSDVSLCEIWHKSRNKQFPILFHAIYEPSKSDRQSHSLYNFKELEVVMDYVKDLMYFGVNGEPLKESDIGIISPYKKQYKRIQEELNLRKWFGIETGSVETFQGKEKTVIIVSFVRSGTQNLGFLDNPRRLNVTLSRPKSLLILIGNPKTLSINKDFEYIIRECHRNNTFVGSAVPAKSDLKKPPSENSTKAQELLSQINQKMQGLQVQNADNEKPKNNRRRGNRGKGRKKGKSKNQVKNDDKDEDDDENDDDGDDKKDDEGRSRQGKDDKSSGKSKERNHIDKNEDNKDDDDVDDDDDEDDSEDQDNDDDDKPSTSSALGKTNNSKKKSENGYGMRQTKKGVAGNVGKISRQLGKANRKNKADGNKNITKSKLDSIFNELPQVPATSPKTSVAYTMEQLLQLRNQQQFYNNLQHNQQPMYHHNPYFNLPPGQPPMAYNPFQYQQRQNFNLSPNRFVAHAPFGPNNTNSSCFKNDNNKQNSSPNATNASKSTVGKANSQSSNKNNYRGRNNSPHTKKGNDASANIRKGNRNPSNERKSNPTLKATNVVNKSQEQKKSSYANGAVNLVSKKETSTTSGNANNRYTPNRGNDESVAATSVYPVARGNYNSNISTTGPPAYSTSTARTNTPRFNTTEFQAHETANNPIRNFNYGNNNATTGPSAYSTNITRTNTPSYDSTAVEVRESTNIPVRSFFKNNIPTTGPTVAGIPPYRTVTTPTNAPRYDSTEFKARESPNRSDQGRKPQKKKDDGCTIS